MRKYINMLLVLLVFFTFCTSTFAQDRPEYVIVIHGGAGTITKKGLSEEKEKAYEEKLNEAFAFGRTNVEKR